MSTELAEVTVKAGLAVAAIVAVLWRHRRPGSLGERRAGPWLAGVAVVAAFAWMNFGAFHGGRFAHRWEQFHYFLGAKYFPELGYDGLYVASMGAQMQAMQGRRDAIQPFLRDLRTNQVVATDTLGEHGHDVRRRFSDARWAEFQRDNAYFLNAGDYEYLRLIRLDHGYNPSPLWTFTARLFAGRAEASDGTQAWLGGLDLLLLSGLFLAVWRTYGSRAGALALLIFGLGYAWRWDWVGGAFLRQDWLAAIGVGICCLRLRKWSLAGALFAYAGLVRLFPLAFLLGPAVLALRGWRMGEDLRWAKRFALGFAVALGLGLAAGALAGRGPGAWLEFASNLRKHQQTWLTNNVGAKLTLLYGPDTFERRLVNGDLPDAFAPWEASMAAAQSRRGVAIAVLAAALLALAAAAAWRAAPDEAAVLGCVAVFALSAPTGYYWAMLALVPLRGPFRRSGWSAAALLALSAGLFGLHRETQVFERIYGLMSWALLLGAIAWTLPDAVAIGAAWRQRRAQNAVLRNSRK